MHEIPHLQKKTYQTLYVPLNSTKHVRTQPQQRPSTARAT